MFSKYQPSTCHSEPHAVLLMDMGYSHFIENDIRTQKDEMPFTRTRSSLLEGQGLRSSIWIPNLHSLPSATRTTCDEQPQTLSEQQRLAFIFAYWSIGNVGSSAHLGQDPLMGAAFIPGSLVSCWVGWCRLTLDGAVWEDPLPVPHGLSAWLVPREWQGSLVKSLSVRAWESSCHSVHRPYPIGQPKVEYCVDACFEYCVESVW